MQIEDYFDFLAPNDIRIKGTRVGIETVLDEYLDGGHTAEQIQQSYPTLNLEQVYATILYYLRNHSAVDAYLREWLEDSLRRQREQDTNPSPAVRRLKHLISERRVTAARE